MLDLPELYTARYFATDILATGELVAVRFSPEPPIIPVPYSLEETSGTFLAEDPMLGEWPWLCSTYWRRLDQVGLDRIAAELAAISERHGGKPLCLVGYEDIVVRGHRSPRTIFGAWWTENTGEEVYELVSGGEAVHHSQLHKQAKPKRPKDPTRDRRWRDAEDRPWPLSRADVEQWLRFRYWQYARTAPKNPHSYTRIDWGPAKMFTKVVLHLRERGEQEVFGGTEHTYYRVAARKIWSMGDPVGATVLVNCKFDDPEDQARLAEEQTGRSPEELGLDFSEWGNVGGKPASVHQPAQPTLGGIGQKGEV